MKETPLSNSIVDRADFSTTSITDGVKSVLPTNTRFHNVVSVPNNKFWGLSDRNTVLVLADNEPIPAGATVIESYEVGQYVGSVTGGARHTHDKPDAYVSGIPVRIDARPETFIK